MSLRAGYFIFLYFLLLPLSAFSQKRQPEQWPQITLRTNPFSFFEADACAMLGVGLQWHPRWAVSIDPGWVFARPYYTTVRRSDDEKIQVSGFKLRNDLRYYFTDFDHRSITFFIAPEFHYKKVRVSSWSDFGINCVNGQCDYIQRGQYFETKKETGGILKLGCTLPSGNKRLTGEIYGGIGFRKIKYKEGIPIPGASFVNPPFRNLLGGRRTTNERSNNMIPLGLKISYRIL